MASFSNTRYSRDETIRAVRDYFAFLVTMYLDESHIKEPPSGGWPSITTDRFPKMNKTDEVMDLLRHLPYIRRTDDDLMQNLLVLPGASFADWEAEVSAPEQNDGWSLRICTEGTIYEDVPHSVIGLTDGDGGNPVFLLDTEHGVIHWAEGFPGEIKNERAFGTLVDSDIRQIDDNPSI